MLSEREKSLTWQGVTPNIEMEEQLYDVTLLALWIDPEHPLEVSDIAAVILKHIEFNWNRLACFSKAEYKSLFGISAKQAQRLKIMIAISKRMQYNVSESITHIKSPNNVFDIMKPFLLHLMHEEFYALYLNNAKKLLEIVCISRGGINATVADGRIIFNKALNLQATGIILCHNHPSGQLKESKSDIELTRNLQQFGKFIDVSILDHLIFTDNGYLSFLEKGLLS